MAHKRVYLADDPFWYKDAIIYELHVKAFYDSDDNGIGDFKGLRKKLDYLSDLGITAIWLLPFYPSPLKDDGYDIADYLDVHPDYGTLKDFKDFLKEAHQRGIRVITELVLNHTSDQHPWFQQSRTAKPGSRWRDFYVWSETAHRYQDARIIFQDFEYSNWRWDPVANAYFWHRFYSNQPDLNFDSPRVQKAVLKLIDFWFGMGVDGLRLDAVPYLYERDGTNCENLPETYEFLRKLRSYIDSKYKGKMLLAEANQWPEDSVEYFGSGDMCQMAFHFPLMPRMFMAIQMEDRFPVIDIVDQTPSIPENCQWAVFLRNHDELTLEMVTDEERDYMYRIYAKDSKARINLGIRRRLAPLLDNDRRKIELMNVLLFTLPGSPVIYYGDELGMGDNYYLGDRNGVRTPMQWSADKNAGFSSANPQKLYLPTIIDPAYHYETINVENGERSPSCLLWWMRRFIAMRKNYKAFGRGSIEFLSPENPKVLAFIRSYEGENLLVVVNLSRHPQFVELDLSKYSGRLPQEVFSKSAFLPIKDSAYMLTIGSHGYFIFELLQKPGDVASLTGTNIVPDLGAIQNWNGFFDEVDRDRLEHYVLPSYIRGRRWFGGKGRQIQNLSVIETIPVGKNSSLSFLMLIEVQYTEGAPDVYMLPLSFAEMEKSAAIVEENPEAMVARLTIKSRRGIIYDGMYSEEFCMAFLAMILRRQTIRGTHGELTAFSGKSLRAIVKKENIALEPKILKAEQSNTSVLFGDELYLKVFRHCQEGVNPDLEISQYLTEWVGFQYAPAFAGGIEYRRSHSSESIAIGILQKHVSNQGDAWRFFMDVAERYFERILSMKGVEVPEVPLSALELASKEIPPEAYDLVGGGALEMASLLGKRTGQMHCVLSSSDVREFAPEPFSLLYQRSIYQSMQSLTKRVFQLLQRNLKTMDEDIRAEAEEVLSLQKNILTEMKAIYKKKLSAGKIRIHGDYHLGQVLFTGKDFVILDFEGEPARTLGERRLKRSPMKDVAGMLRSFHYVAYTALFRGASLRPEDWPVLEEWADLWRRCLSGSFLAGYLGTVSKAGFLPEDPEELETMLRVFLLEKAIYELGYELNNRPDWVMIPLRGIKDLMVE